MLNFGAQTNFDTWSQNLAMFRPWNFINGQ